MLEANLYLSAEIAPNIHRVNITGLNYFLYPDSGCANLSTLCTAVIAGYNDAGGQCRAS